MKFWNGDAVNAANLNSTFMFDAVVDDGFASNSGAMYTTISAAITAGHRAILIRPGIYNENVTIVNQGTWLCGSQPPHLASSANQITITGQVTVPQPYCRLTNLQVYQSSGQGFLFYRNASFCMADNCHARETGYHGFYIGYDGGAGDISNLVLHRCAAYQPGQTSASDGFYIHDIDTNFDITMVGCHAYDATRDGVRLCYNGTPTITLLRVLKMLGCTLKNNDGNGVTVGGEASLLTGVNFIFSNSGDGIQIQTPLSSKARSIITGNEVRNNAGAGIRLISAASTIVVSGNTSISNSGDYTNCGSCPGYTTGTNGTNV